MAQSESTESLLESAVGTAESPVTEAFALLGDETRLAILLAIWETYDPHADDNAVPFSRILNRLDVDDPGNLRYHLEKLRGQFLRQEAAGEGYELRAPGMKLVRTVLAGAGVGDVSMDATEIDQPCLSCGAPTVISYDDGCLVWACSECAGATPEATDTAGFLSATPFPPAGLRDRSPAEIQLASIAEARQKKQRMFDGFCPDCSGAVEGRLEWCADHDGDGICEHCGKQFVAWARFQCQVCKRHDISSPKTLALFHPAVVSFYDDHGVSIRFRADDFENARQVFDRMHDHGLELVSTGPPRVAVTASMNGETICLTFDETAAVVDVRR
ncbi:MAG: winged helix-turn-helix transcriptional regulator [Halodesulfurarchaeum sp.]|nr:winged helix-turn-helix transcriptional regulator [Halodesulfurarchaeum sp.]